MNKVITFSLTLLIILSSNNLSAQLKANNWSTNQLKGKVQPFSQLFSEETFDNNAHHALLNNYLEPYDHVNGQKTFNKQGQLIEERIVFSDGNLDYKRMLKYNTGNQLSDVEFYVADDILAGTMSCVYDEQGT